MGAGAGWCWGALTQGLTRALTGALTAVSYCPLNTAHSHQRRPPPPADPALSTFPPLPSLLIPSLLVPAFLVRLLSTPADSPSEQYLQWMRKGIHIITPNKKMGSGPLARYQQLKQHQRDSYIHFFYEGTVGAGGSCACCAGQLLRGCCCCVGQLLRGCCCVRGSCCVWGSCCGAAAAVWGAALCVPRKG